MPSLITIVTTLLILYATSSAYRFLVNLHKARRSGLEYICVPLDQNALPWLVISGLTQKRMQAIPWLWRRIAPSIYGSELSYRPIHSTSALVTTGSFEVSTHDPELITHMLAHPQDFQQHRGADMLLSRFGSSVLTSNGPTWVRQRKIVASTINERISSAVFEESIKQAQAVATEGSTTALFDQMKAITSNVLLTVGMGVSEEPSSNERAYISATQTMVENLMGAFLLPLFIRRAAPSDLLNKVGKAEHDFPDLARTMLASQRAKDAVGSNIMGQLLQASKADNHALTDNEIIGNLFVFTVAGYETTANTLSYALLMLCRYPQWQDWLYTEIETLTQNEPLAYTSVQPKARRLLAVMLETLRLFPPIFRISKQTKTSQIVKGVTIPADATIHLNLMAVHRIPAVWQNLNHECRDDKDEELFRPSRWINPDGSLYQPAKGTFLPWSIGPRICPGQKMAQVEFTSVILTLLRKHRIEAVPLEAETEEQLNLRLDGYARDNTAGLTMQMKGVYNMHGKGLALRLVKR